jgi:DNA-directed RNA polymerase subunit RPC12/RpoP
MFCQNCSQEMGNSDASYCPNCGTQIQVKQVSGVSNVNKSKGLRRDFAVSYLLALCTGISWMTQGWVANQPALWFLNPLYLIYIPHLLSIVARVTFILSFVRVRFNWLVVSSYASTASLVISFATVGFNQKNPAVLVTTVFSVATLASVLILSNKHNRSFVKLDRKW